MSRRDSGSTDLVLNKYFQLRNKLKQCAEHKMSIIATFIDFKTVFDSVHRPSLWNIAKHYEIPYKFIHVFKSFYKDQSFCVRIEECNTDFFHIVTRVRYCHQSEVE